jgi:hypothetical protein
MFVEDLAPFMADFGQVATLDGVAVRGIFDTQTSLEFAAGALYDSPSLLVTASDASGAAAGHAVVVGSNTYTVRQVLAEPPDGAMVRLVLA